jgi:hypothetical protein
MGSAEETIFCLPLQPFFFFLFSRFFHFLEFQGNLSITWATPQSFCFSVCFSNRVSLNFTWAGLELYFLLPPPPEYQDYRLAPPCQAEILRAFYCFFYRRLICLLCLANSSSVFSRQPFLPLLPPSRSSSYFVSCSFPWSLMHWSCLWWSRAMMNVHICVPYKL